MKGEKIMKKTNRLFAFLLIFVFAIALTGCQGGTDGGNSDSVAVTLANSVNNLMEATSLYGEGKLSTTKSGKNLVYETICGDSTSEYDEEYFWQDYFYAKDYELKGGIIVDSENNSLTELEFDMVQYSTDKENVVTNAVFGRDGRIYSCDIGSSERQRFNLSEPKNIDEFKNQLTSIVKDYDMLRYTGNIEDVNRNLYKGGSVDSNVLQNLTTITGNLRKGLLKGLASFVAVTKDGDTYTIDGKMTIVDFLDKEINALKIANDEPQITLKEFYGREEVKAISEPITKNIKAADVIAYIDNYIKITAPYTGVWDLKSLMKTAYGIDLPNAGSMTLDSYIKNLFDVKINLEYGQITFGEMPVSSILEDSAKSLREAEESKKEVSENLSKCEIILTISGSKIKYIKFDIQSFEADGETEKDRSLKISGEFTFTPSIPKLIYVDRAVKKADV